MKYDPHAEIIMRSIHAAFKINLSVSWHSSLRIQLSDLIIKVFEKLLYLRQNTSKKSQQNLFS